MTTETQALENRVAELEAAVHNLVETTRQLQEALAEAREREESAAYSRAMEGF